MEQGGTNGIFFSFFDVVVLCVRATTVPLWTVLLFRLVWILPFALLL